MSALSLQILVMSLVSSDAPTLDVNADDQEKPIIIQLMALQSYRLSAVKSLGFAANGCNLWFLSFKRI